MELNNMPYGATQTETPIFLVYIDRLVPRHGVDPEKIQKYLLLPEDAHPISLSGRVVMDGHHRVAVASARGQKTIRAVAFEYEGKLYEIDPAVIA
jgi:ParB-like chromosome segregation protein Spo0J